MDTAQIGALPPFAGLPAAELAALAETVTEVGVDASVDVVTLDDYGSAVYFIQEGEADVRTDGGEQGETLGPGDSFGEIGLLLTGQRTATVVSRTPMRLLSLSAHDFERIRSQVPELERSLRQTGLGRAHQ